MNGVTPARIPCFRSELSDAAAREQFAVTAQAIYQINSGLHASYIMQSAFSLERQVTKIATLRFHI